MKSKASKIVVVGLGYVGLPLAVALAAHRKVIGFDVDAGRIDELRRGHDRIREVAAEALGSSGLTLTADPEGCVGADVYLVTVLTPIDADNAPDLAPLISASRAIAGWIDPARRPTIVYESTVYPGSPRTFAGRKSSASAACCAGAISALAIRPSGSSTSPASTGNDAHAEPRRNQRMRRCDRRFRRRPVGRMESFPADVALAGRMVIRSSNYPNR